MDEVDLRPEGLELRPGEAEVHRGSVDHVAVEILQRAVRCATAIPTQFGMAMEVAAPLLPEVEMASDPYALADGCDALIVVTEWNEFKQLDLRRLRQALAFPLLVDGRNIYEPDAMTRLGFVYCGIGRGQLMPQPSTDGAWAAAPAAQPRHLLAANPAQGNGASGVGHA